MLRQTRNGCVACFVRLLTELASSPSPNYDSSDSTTYDGGSESDDSESEEQGAVECSERAALTACDQRRYNGEQSEAAYMDTTKARTIEISTTANGMKKELTQRTQRSAPLYWPVVYKPTNQPTNQYARCD